MESIVSSDLPSESPTTFPLEAAGSATKPSLSRSSSSSSSSSSSPSFASSSLPAGEPHSDDGEKGGVVEKQSNFSSADDNEHFENVLQTPPVASSEDETLGTPRSVAVDSPELVSEALDHGDSIEEGLGVVGVPPHPLPGDSTAEGNPTSVEHPEIVVSEENPNSVECPEIEAPEEKDYFFDDPSSVAASKAEEQVVAGDMVSAKSDDEGNAELRVMGRIEEDQHTVDVEKTAENDSMALPEDPVVDKNVGLTIQEVHPLKTDILPSVELKESASELKGMLDWKWWDLIVGNAETGASEMPKHGVSESPVTDSTVIKGEDLVDGSDESNNVIQSSTESLRNDDSGSSADLKVEQVELTNSDNVDGFLLGVASSTQGSNDKIWPESGSSANGSYEPRTENPPGEPVQTDMNIELELPAVVAADSKREDLSGEVLASSCITSEEFVTGDLISGVAISSENISSDSLSDLAGKHDIADAGTVEVEAKSGGGTEDTELPVETTLTLETTEDIIREMEDGCSSSQSAIENPGEYLQKVDGLIVNDTDEEVDTDEEGEGKHLFDSSALAELLKAATNAESGGSIMINGRERLFSTERPAGLGSTVPSLKPAASRLTRPNIFSSSELAVEADNNMDEEEKKLQEKIQGIRVKFLRLVQRLGHSPEDTVAAQVLYRLGLAEGIRRGRHTNRAFGLESAKKTAMQMEASGEDDLDFSCNILVLGKTGVGKSATINSIFGEEKTPISAFEPSTNTVQEIVGMVDGVKIRVIDTPGLKSSVMEQSSNKKILSLIQTITKKCPPDIALYVDRLDAQTRDFNDLPLLKSISTIIGPSIWLNGIVALTHAASAPPDGPNGTPLSYEVFVAQRSHTVQHSIRQAAGDMRLMNPVALVENHPSCRRNREGQRVLPNGQIWRSQLLLLCYSSKILAEANSLLKLQDPSPGKSLYGFRFRSPPLPYLLSSLLQSRTHPKLPTDAGVDNVDSDIDLDDLPDLDNEEEDEYDQLPPFKPLKKSQIDMLSKEQRKAYFEEYDYRVKLLQKKQWREELQRLRESKKRGKDGRNDFVYGDMGTEDLDQEDGSPAPVPVPLPDMVLPPSFDADYPTYRYRFLEPTSQLLARPVLDTHGWDHDCGYDGVSLEETLAIVNRFPAAVSVQITKDKKEFNIHLDSSLSAKHGEKGSTLAGFDIQTVGRQLAYILRGETKFQNFKKNRTTAGLSVTFLGENVATGLKIEDQISIGKQVILVASTGAVRSQGDMAYGANLEARLKEKDYPIGQDQSTFGLSLVKWRGELALGANLQSQLSVGRNSKMAVRVGLNNKLSGQISIRTSSSDQLQIALVGIIPVATAIYRTIWPGESYLSH